MGELAADCEPDTFSERAPFLEWCRMGAGALSEGAAAAAAAAACGGGGAAARVEVEGAGVGVGVVLALDDAEAEADADAGSAVSCEPVRERNESSRGSVMLARGWLLLACRCC